MSRRYLSYAVENYFGGRTGQPRMRDFSTRVVKMRFHGVMVSTLDSESSDPSSNLGGTYCFADPQSILCVCLLHWIFFSFSLLTYTTSMETRATGKVVDSTAVIAQLGER